MTPSQLRSVVFILGNEKVLHHDKRNLRSRYLPLDNLLYITRQYINPDVSHSAITRLLKRKGLARPEDVILKAEGEPISAKKTCRDYEPGFGLVDALTIGPVRLNFYAFLPPQTKRSPQLQGMRVSPLSTKCE